MTLISTDPQRLYLLQLMTSTVHGAGRTLVMVLGCFLVEMSDGKHILIDSGLAYE
jgi:N-acyl homoserine lactone hydrolase